MPAILTRRRYEKGQEPGYDLEAHGRRRAPNKEPKLDVIMHSLLQHVMCICTLGSECRLQRWQHDASHVYPRPEHEQVWSKLT